MHSARVFQQSTYASVDERRCRLEATRPPGTEAVVAGVEKYELAPVNRSAAGADCRNCWSEEQTPVADASARLTLIKCLSVVPNNGSIFVFTRSNVDRSQNSVW